MATELYYIQPATGKLVDPYAVSPFVGTGYLDVTKTVITLSFSDFPSPVPQAGDLVRILTGTNVNSPFHRIISVTSRSITVDVAFPNPDVGFSFLVTVANNLRFGTTCTVTATTLTDPAADFYVDGINPGVHCGTNATRSPIYL